MWLSIIEMVTYIEKLWLYYLQSCYKGLKWEKYPIVFVLVSAGIELIFFLVAAVFGI